MKLTLMLVLLGVCAAAAATTTTRTDSMDDSARSGRDNVFVSTILRDHEKIRSMMTTFQANPSDKDTASNLIDILTLHDRRERTLLYPIAYIMLNDAEVNDMKKEHNLVLLSLLHLRDADFNNATVRNDMKDVCDSVKKHLNEEESTLLPLMTKFLSPRPKLTAALAHKWSSVSNTNVPLLTELVEAEHITLRVITTALRMYAKAARKNPDDASLAQTRDKLARALVKELHEHGICETGVFYPLVSKVVGHSATSKLMDDHTKLGELLAKLKASPTIDNTWKNTLIRAVKLETRHMAFEQKLMVPLRSYLQNNVDENDELVATFLKCQMLNMNLA